MPSMTLSCSICNKPMQKTRTSKPQGEAAHNTCRKAIGGLRAHGLSGYRGGCRCDVCREAQNAAVREYAAQRRERDGVGPSAQHRRKSRGIDPLTVINCTLCGEPLRYIRTEQVAEPMHKACKNTPKWKREGLPDPSIARQAKKAMPPKLKVDLSKRESKSWKPL